MNWYVLIVNSQISNDYPGLTSYPSIALLCSVTFVRMNMLELYQSENCPHSGKVREKLSEHGVSYVVHNPRLPGDEGGDETNSQTLTALRELGGEDQIPFLVDTARGETLYDSDDIVAYLDEHYS